MSVHYRSADVAGVNVAYREAGSPASPTLLRLHGFPASSFAYRHLMTALADRFHLVAPDYPGFGNSEAPNPDEWPYTFDHLAQTVEALVDHLGLSHYGLFMPADPQVGQKFYQEVAPGVALDRVEIISLTERVKVPAGTFVNVLKTEETTPLEPDALDHKFYAPGVGLLFDGGRELASFGPAQQ